MIKKISILKSNYIGVYARVWEDIAFLPASVEESVVTDFEQTLQVRVNKTFIDNSNLIGAHVVMNSNGLILPSIVAREEFSFDIDGRNILFLKNKINALGNDILANDTAAMIHKGFDVSARKKIQDALGVEVIKGTIGNISTVGSAGVVTQKGMLVTPEAKDEEIEFLSNFFKVPVKAGTANFGNTYVGSSVVANSKGIFVGKETTPIEIGRIDDVLS